MGDVIDGLFCLELDHESKGPGWRLVMPYITQCVAPDVASLAATPLWRAEFVALIFDAQMPMPSVKASRLFTCYLLVVDKVVREYVAGRELLIAYTKSNNETKLYIEGLGRFETCINSIKRALRLLDRISRNNESPPVNKTLRDFLDSLDKSFTDTRDAIEHMDEFIVDGVLGDGEAHLLVAEPSGEYLEISKCRLSYYSLHKVVSKLHQAGSAMIGAPARKLQALD